MKRLLLLLFLLFYVASSYAISQERVRLIAGEVQHSPAHQGEVQIEDDRQETPDDFPNYRQAKPKTICIVAIGPAPHFVIIPLNADGSLNVHSVSSLYALYRGESVLSRAPPLKADPNKSA
jgi:hypothetical protein